MIQPLLRTLRRAGSLTPECENTLSTTFGRTIEIRRHGTILREGEPPSLITAMVEGMAFRYKVLASGKRQILGIVVPGDICDLSSIFFPQLDYGIEAVTDCEIAVAKRQAVLDAVATHPDIGHALWWASLAGEAISREWIVNLGRRSAHQRIAHFLCEMFLRTRSTDPGDDHSRILPLTQEELADVAGLTVVHVNRVLQDLRAAGTISLRQRILTVHDWARLSTMAEFEAGYLLQDRAPQIT